MNDLLVMLQDYRVAKLFSDIRKFKAITFHHRVDEKVDADFRFTNIPYQEGQLLLQDCATRGMAHTVELYIMATVAGDGPRIYEAKQLDCEAMEQMHLKIPVEDYHQPFPTMIVKLPEDYSKKKIVPNASINDLFKELDHFPRYIAIHHDPVARLLMLACHLSSGQVISKLFWKEKGEETIEDIFHGTTEKIFKDSMTINDQEWKVALEAMRIGLNCSYLLHHYGCIKLGPKNPGYYQRLLRYIDVAKGLKDPIRTEKAELTALVVPQYYDFRERERKLYHRSEGKTDRTVRTHWRQGHIARQRYGRAFSLVKTIVRLPTLVNP